MGNRMNCRPQVLCSYIASTFTWWVSAVWHQWRSTQHPFNEKEDYLPGLSLTILFSDERFQCFHTLMVVTSPNSLVSLYIDIIRALDVIHKEEHVHSDIRKENLIFGANGRAWIIDFDLADREGTRYPGTYSSLVYRVEERHYLAKPCLRGKKEHNPYCLSGIILSEPLIYNSNLILGERSAIWSVTSQK